VRDYKDWHYNPTAGFVYSPVPQGAWGSDEESKPHYCGGYLICESVGGKEIGNLITAAPDMRNLLTGEHWLVWSNEHAAWWGPNRRQYFTEIESAGRYTLEEAMKICGLRSQTGGNPTELIQPSPEWIEGRKAAIAKAEGGAK